MSNVVFYNSYKLKKGASIPDFLLAKSNLTQQQVSKNKGWISSTYLREGDLWADYSVWETMEDFKAFVTAARANPTDLAKNMYSFIDSSTSESHTYTVEKYITSEGSYGQSNQTL